MAKEIIEFFDGEPVILEVEASDGEESRVYAVKRAYYVYNSGYFALAIDTGSDVKSYESVLYEDIEEDEDGTISFEFEGSKRTIRPIRDEDGVFILMYEMPFPAEALRELIRIDGRNNTLVTQSIQALSDPSTGDIVGFIYDISSLGMFFRSDSEWDLPTPEMLEVLESSNSTSLDLEGAKKMISQWDKGKKLKIEDLKKYVMEEE